MPETQSRSIVTPSPFNAAAWAQLPLLTQATGSIEAALMEFDVSGNEKPAWLFLINPRSIKYSDSASYTTISPHASKVAYQHYAGASGASLTISDLLLYAHLYGRVVTPLIEGVRSLLRAKVEEDRFAPPLLSFKMGGYRFAPCVLKQVDWEEKAFINDQPADVKMSLQLLEVPRPITEAERQQQAQARSERTARQREEQGLPPVPLTDRLRSDASAAAKTYLESNIAQWTPEVQVLIRNNQYRLSTNADTGAVTMLKTDGTAIGVVARSSGRQVMVSRSITTIPIAAGVSLPSTPQNIGTQSEAGEGMDA